jgi:glycosyltransferase involved in cell wall biosynthesis
MSLKVLHCIHSLSGGGAETQLVNFANNSNKANIESAIFCVNPASSNLDSSVSKLYTLSNSDNYPWGMVGEIRAVIKKFKPDVVHCWLPVTLIVPGLLAAKLEGVSTVTSYRSAKRFKNIKDIFEFVGGVLFADGVVSNNSPAQSNIYYRYLFNRKINSLIPNSVEVQEQFRSLKQKRSENDRFEILFVGRLVDAKNWQTLLLAIKNIKTENKFKLTLCGNGDDSKVETMIRELDLADKVKMLGYRQDVHSIMAGSDLLVLPSWYEGMPNVVLEAMNIGLPCVVSRVAAHTSLFLDEPVVKYFDPSNPTDLAHLLSNFIDKKENVSLLVSNGIVFSEKYNPDILSEKYKIFYDKVLNKN